MASLYKDKRSPFWQVQYIDKEGRRRGHSTELRWDDPKQTAEARILVAKIAASELARGECKRGNNKHGNNKDAWEWVPKFLKNHSESPKTLLDYNNRWNWILLFLTNKRILTPAAVHFRHGQEYIDWRTSFKKRTGKVVCHNTALHELKTFSLVMQQATRLELCPANPLVKLGIRKELPDEKPEITDKEFKVVLGALDQEPEWMQVSWKIAMHTGCRLRETPIPMECIDFKQGRITFPKPKGGRERAFTVPMPKALRPLLEKLRDRGEKITCELPFQPSRQWQHFFRRVGLPHLTFHCLRVTFITRLARKGVPPSSARRLVNHASETIHRIYQKLGVEDVRNYADELSFPES